MDVTSFPYLMIFPQSRPFWPLLAAKGRERRAPPAVGLLCSFLYCGATLGGLWAFAGACGRAGRGEGREEKMAAGGQKGPRKRKGERFRDPINVPFRSESDRIFFSSASWQEKRKPTAKYPPLFSTGDSFLLYGGREGAGAVVEVASGRSFVTFA